MFVTKINQSMGLDPLFLKLSFLARYLLDIGSVNVIII